MAYKKVVIESSAGNISQKAATAGNSDTVTTNANLTGDVTSSGNATTITTDAVDIAMLSASGTASGTTFLRGDNTWATPADISSIANLTDTTIDGTPADGEVMVYDTNNDWQNQTLAETGIQPLNADLTSLSSCQSGAAGKLALLTSTEVGILDGATVTTAELNTLDGFDGDVDDLKFAKALYDTDVTAVEFDYLDGVTSNIQTQLDAKAALAGSTSQNFSINAMTINGNISASQGNELKLMSDWQNGTKIVVNAVEFTQTGSSSGDISADNMTLAGNLNVTGVVNSVSTENLLISDNIMVLNSDKTGGADIDAGLLVERGTGGDFVNNKSLYWDEGDDKWKFASSTSVAVGGTYNGDVVSQYNTGTYDANNNTVPVGHFQWDGTNLYVRTA